MTGSGAHDGPVLIAYDGSPAAQQAIIDSAGILGSCKILVVTVWEEGLAYEAAGAAMPADAGSIAPIVDPRVAREVDDATHEQADRVADEGVALARSHGLDAQPLALPDEADVPTTLLDLIEARNAAAVVVGSRGRRGLRARLEGSTSRALLRHAACPVVVVHAAEDKHRGD
jgi:nucleotide-binding universal stress UspA family protein